MPGMPYKIKSIVTRKLEGVNHFHYYLCHQLGGGMEINMASWITHLRIADALLGIIGELPHIDFIIGNIAPDSGVPINGKDEFEPPVYITHWKVGGNSCEINAEKFLERYLVCNRNHKEMSFYLGYYVHLLTDYIWVQDIYPQLKMQFMFEYKNDPNFMQKVKNDMFEIDCIYLNRYPNFRAYSVFTKVSKFPNVFLDYFSEKAFEEKVEIIRKYYEDFKGKLSQKPLYLGEKQVNDFIYKAVGEIQPKVKDILKGEYEK